MEIKEIFENLKNIENNLYGSLTYLPEYNSIEWEYDGLLNPNIYNEDQLYDIYKSDYEVIMSFIGLDKIILNEPYINDNYIRFEIYIE